MASRCVNFSGDFAPPRCIGIRWGIEHVLLEGFRDEACKAELAQIETRRNELNALLASAETDPPLPALHPYMAEVFRQRTTLLAEPLEDPAKTDAARGALRGFIDRIVVSPDESLQVVGNFGEMLTAAAGVELAAAV